MKRFTLLVSSVFVFSALSFGQTEIRETAKEVQTMEQLATSSPAEHAKLLEFAKNHGSTIMDFPKGKEAKKLDGEVTMEQAALIDPIKMGLSILSTNQYFRISGTEKMLMVKSVFILQQEMKTTK
jgi:hypothetical protein